MTDCIQGHSGGNVNIVVVDSIGHCEKKIQMFETTDLTPLDIHGLDEELGIHKKDGYTRRIAHSHFVCCCPQKHARRSTQTIHDLRTRVAKYIEVENCALLGHYAASSGNFLPKFPDNLSILSSRVLNMGPKGCPETSVRYYHYSLRNDP
jgi:hypothetical protein